MNKFKQIILFSIFLLFVSIDLNAQQQISELGIRSFKILYKSDTVEFIVKSKKGEGELQKPLFLFCQGSLPQPLFIREEDNSIWLATIPFVLPNNFLDDYHLVVISKPFVPLIASKKLLGRGMGYYPNNGKASISFTSRDNLDYYTGRNLDVINYLIGKSWIDANKIVVAGHSEGSSIAVKMAINSDKITQLIYSGGSPLGRTMRTLAQARMEEKDSANKVTNWLFSHLEKVVENPDIEKAPNGGNSFKSDFSFSQPLVDDLLKLKIPILVTYGTKDKGAIFNDYLRVLVILNKKDNYTFKEYAGTDHNFFPVDSEGRINQNVFNWDKVGALWFNWSLKK